MIPSEPKGSCLMVGAKEKKIKIEAWRRLRNGKAGIVAGELSKDTWIGL